LGRLGRIEDARVSFTRALDALPAFPEAHQILGRALVRLGRNDEAAASCRRALQLRPQFAEAHANLANALRSIGRLEEAVAAYRRALEIKPDCVLAHTEQGLPPQRELSLRYAMGKYFDDFGDFDNAFRNYRRANELAKQCGSRWQVRQKISNSSVERWRHYVQFVGLLKSLSQFAPPSRP
jgi:tetratricopeptide (TPR) repeat protein